MMKIYLSYIVFNCAIPGFRCMIPARWRSCFKVLVESFSSLKQTFWEISFSFGTISVSFHSLYSTIGLL